VSYDIIGRIQDRILFFKEKGPDRSVTLYDENLVFQSERQINLDEKRCFLYEVTNLDTSFAITYGYRKDGEDIIKLDVFDQGAVRTDSVVITQREKKFKGLNFESLESENETKLALYSIDDKDKIRVITIDLEKQELINDRDYQFKGRNLYDDVEDFKVDDDGFFYMLMQTNNYKSAKDRHTASIYIFSRTSEAVEEIIIPLQDIVCQHKGRMENFKVSEVIWKQDASAILAFEISYDVNRRAGSSYTGYSANSPAVNRGSPGAGGVWSDHYRDDMLLISLDVSAQEEWHQVFYKKQFSQNDNGIFSSFFPFLTPSRLRLIYNDEIKSNSTVSEYILDGAGNYKRSSVLSTEYQDLKLRFADAYQISSTELLVPSQRSYTVNLVKIDFAQ